jgi:hypothetical protein
MYAANDTLHEQLMSPVTTSGFATVGCWLNSLDKSFTYVFELTSPLNRVVVKYADYRITILAARETANGKYLPTDVL